MYIILGIYVDDILALSTNESFLDHHMQKIKEKFNLKNLGKPNKILGIEISRNEEGHIMIRQQGYIESLLRKYNMENCNPVKTPMEASAKEGEWSDDESPSTKEVPYQQLIGSLMYLVQGTRPDLAFAVHYLSRYNSNFMKHHWTAAKRILRYLQGTKDLAICYKRSGSTLEGYSDASWNSWTDDGRSTSGYVYKLGDAAILWNSSKQTLVAQSTCEAEYLALSECVKAGMWVKGLLTELCFDYLVPEPMVLGIDNTAAKTFAENSIQTRRTRHINLKFLFVKKEIEDGRLELCYTPTDLMVADIFTKPLPHVKHNFCVTECGFVSCLK